ncbi:MAG: phasin family protein [Geminicoccaceae bacterium]
MAKLASKPFTLPMFDADRLIAAQQRNLDALASAGQIVVDGARAIAQRQSELMQASVEQLVAASQSVLSAKPTDFEPADQVAKARSWYESAVINARELTEIAVKAQTEAADVLTKAMLANVDELKSLAKAA